MKARILAEARGNPLALMQLPRGLTPADLAGGFGLPDARPLTNRIEQSFLQRAIALQRETQLLLLTAAAEPLGDVSLLWRAERDVSASAPEPSFQPRPPACSSLEHVSASRIRSSARRSIERRT